MVTHNRNSVHSGVVWQLGGDIPMSDILQAGYCVVRAEVQGDHLLITVITNTSTTRTVRTAPYGPPRHFVDVPEALEAVGQFLRQFPRPDAVTYRSELC
jgi:hypothetical protein